MASITAELLFTDDTPGFHVEITNGTHAWHADEPIELGGTDKGPNPYDLLLGSLAACTSITLSMYAKRKNIKITSLSVEYSHDKVHADDCKVCDESKKGMVDRVTSKIFIDGDFDAATRKRFEYIAQNCPVHKTLANGIVFDEAVFAG